jgi:ferredoxin
VEQAIIQGLRCLQCSVNTVFDSSKCILCNGCVDVCPWDCLKIVPAGALSGSEELDAVAQASLDAPISEWRREHTPTVAAMIKDDTACTRCALCAQRCPTGAITMETFRFEETLAYE